MRKKLSHSSGNKKNKVLQQSVAQKLYETAKKYVSLPEGGKQRELVQESLRFQIDLALGQGKSADIESAIDIAIEKDSPYVHATIVNEAEKSLSHASVVENDQNFTSSMLLIPCIVMTVNDIATNPAVRYIEQVMQKHLLQAGIIEQLEDFILSPAVLEKEVVHSLNLQDAADFHNANVAIFNHKELAHRKTLPTQLEMEEIADMVYFPAFLKTYSLDTQVAEQNVEAFIEKIISGDAWAKISEEINAHEKEVKYSFLCPDYVYSCQAEAEHFLQMSQLTCILEYYREEENIDFGYMETVNPDQYIIFIFDNEDYSVQDFIVYEKDLEMISLDEFGNREETDMLAILKEKSNEAPYHKLWHFEGKLSLDMYDELVSKDNFYLDKFIKNRQEVELNDFNSYTHFTASKTVH